MVGGEDHADAVWHAVLAQVLFIDPQHVRRGSRVRLHVLIKGEAVNFTQITHFVDAQDVLLEIAVETS